MVGGSGLAAAAAGGAVVDPVLRAAFEADLDRLKELLTGDPAGALNVSEWDSRGKWTF